MPRPSNTQKAVQKTVRTYRRARKPRVKKQLPDPYKKGMPVKITTWESPKKIKLGLVTDLCKDNGITVQLTNPKVEGVAEYVCIHVERGDTIKPIINVKKS